MTTTTQSTTRSQADVDAFVATWGPPERVTFYPDPRDLGRFHVTLVAGPIARSIRLLACTRAAAILEVTL